MPCTPSTHGTHFHEPYLYMAWACLTYTPSVSSTHLNRAHRYIAPICISSTDTQYTPAQAPVCTWHTGWRGSLPTTLCAGSGPDMYTTEGSEGSSHPGPLTGIGHRKPKKMRQKALDSVYSAGGALRPTVLPPWPSPSLPSDEFQGWVTRTSDYRAHSKIS